MIKIEKGRKKAVTKMPNYSLVHLVTAFFVIGFANYALKGRKRLISFICFFNTVFSKWIHMIIGKRARQRFFKKLKIIFKTMPFFIKRVHLLIGEVRHEEVL